MSLRKKELFYVRKKVLMATKPRGAGLKALVAGPARFFFFCGFPNFVSRSLVNHTLNIGNHNKKMVLNAHFDNLVGNLNLNRGGGGAEKPILHFWLTKSLHFGVHFIQIIQN